MSKFSAILALALLCACVSAQDSCDVTVGGKSYKVPTTIVAGHQTGTDGTTQYDAMVSLCRPALSGAVESALNGVERPKAGTWNYYPNNPGSFVFVNAEPSSSYIYPKGFDQWTGITWAESPQSSNIVGTYTTASSNTLKLTLECGSSLNAQWKSGTQSSATEYDITLAGACTAPGAGTGSGNGGTSDGKTGAPGKKNSGGIGGGWIFVIIVLVTTFVYCLGGIIFKSKRKGTSGTESIPNIDFWRGLPGLVKDGVKFTFSGCKRNSDYQDVDAL